MEKTFKLEQKELAALDQLEQDKTRALAQYGALSLDLKNAEQRISRHTFKRPELHRLRSPYRQWRRHTDRPQGLR